MISCLSEKYYALYHYDYASPAFCSFYKLYVGNKNDFLKFAENLERSKSYLKTAEAIKSYFDGNTNAKHKFLSQEIPVLVPVAVVSSSEATLQKHDWEHINVWGFPYPMKTDSVSISQILVKHNGKYVRCIRAEFTGLLYESFLDKKYKELDSIFGMKENFVFLSFPSGKKLLKNILYIEEDESDSFEEQEQKLKDSTKIKIKAICDDIFGDG